MVDQARPSPRLLALRARALAQGAPSLLKRMWHIVPLKARDFLALAFPVVVILVTAGIAVVGHIQRTRVEASLTRHGRMVTELNRSMLLLVDAETGMRGYLLTRRPVFLEPYEAALRELPATIDRIRGLMDEEIEPSALVDMQNRLSRIDASAGGELADLAWQKRYAASRDYDARIMLQHLFYSKSLMDSLRVEVATMQKNQDATLDRQLQRISGIQSRDYLAVLLTLVIGLGSRFATRYFYTTRVLVRLRRVVVYLRALRRGHYPGALTVGPADVIGDLEAETSLLGADLRHESPWDPDVPESADPLPPPHMAPTRF